MLANKDLTVLKIGLVMGDTIRVLGEMRKPSVKFRNFSPEIQYLEESMRQLMDLHHDLFTKEESQNGGPASNSN